MWSDAAGGTIHHKVVITCCATYRDRVPVMVAALPGLPVHVGQATSVG